MYNWNCFQTAPVKRDAVVPTVSVADSPSTLSVANLASQPVDTTLGFLTAGAPTLVATTATTESLAVVETVHVITNASPVATPSVAAPVVEASSEHLVPPLPADPNANAKERMSASFHEFRKKHPQLPTMQQLWHWVHTALRTYSAGTRVTYANYALASLSDGERRSCARVLKHLEKEYALVPELGGAAAATEPDAALSREQDTSWRATF